MMERIKKMTLKELCALQNLIVEERENRIENELSGICEVLVSNISALLDCCQRIGRHSLGNIEIDCEECDRAMDIDILNGSILEGVQRVLGDYVKE